MKIRIVFSGRNYQAGQSLPAALELPQGSTVTEAIEKLAELIGEGNLPGGCLVALGGTHLGTVASHRPEPLAEDDELVVIAPVAGG